MYKKLNINYFLIVIYVCFFLLLILFHQEILAFIGRAQAKLSPMLDEYMRSIKNGDLYKIIPVATVALVYGLFHGLGPGHGKVILFSYVLSKRLTSVKAVFVAFIMTLVHVVSSIFFVFLIDKTLNMMSLRMGISNKTNFIQLISYGAIIILGLYIIYTNIRSFTIKGKLTCGCGCNDDKESLFVAIFAGIIPCPGIIMFLLYSMAHNMLFAGALIVLIMGIGILLVMLASTFLALALRGAIINADGRFQLAVSLFGSFLMTSVAFFMFIHKLQAYL